MSQSGLKDMRKQIRNVMQECLPELLTQAISVEIMKRVDARLDAIHEHLKTVLVGVEKRSKDVASSLLRGKPPSLDDIK